MQYTNYGFALGFFLLSLGIPLDYYCPESRGATIDESCREKPEPYPHESSRTNGWKGTYHLYWSDLLAEIDAVLRPLMHHARGYRRINANNVLEHEVRRRIYQLICKNPGIDLATLVQLSECNESTLRYHVERIAEENCITIFDQGKSYHLFENHNAFSSADQLYLSRYSSGLTGRILQMIHKSPGITRKELAAGLGIASPTVTRTVSHLVHEGCILLKKEGKCTRHYLPIEALSTIQRVHNT